MKFSRIALAVAAVSVMATSAFAGQAATPKALKEAESRNQLKVLKQFEGPSGLTGWVVTPGASANGAKPMIMFSTADGKTLITGMPVLVDEAGRNLSNEYTELHIPKPDFTAVWNDLMKAKTINTGKQGANPVFVFFDPNCIYCNFAYRAIDVYAKAGADIRWVPVGFLRPDSANKMAAIMTAKDPVAALREHEAKYKQGGIKPAEKVSPQLKAALDANAMLMQKAEVSGTPALFYKDKAGKVQVIGGMPRLSQLPEITGIAEQAIDDPELTRFK